MQASIKITQRMLNKSIIDANKSVVAFAKEYLPHDYDHLATLPSRKLVFIGVWTHADNLPAPVRLYLRPRGDRLLSIGSLKLFAKAGDTVTFSPASDPSNYQLELGLIEGEAA